MNTNRRATGRKSRKRRPRKAHETWSSRNEYGNTVIRPWRRNNAGGWSRS